MSLAAPIMPIFRSKLIEIRKPPRVDAKNSSILMTTSRVAFSGTTYPDFKSNNVKQHRSTNVNDPASFRHTTGNYIYFVLYNKTTE